MTDYSQHQQLKTIFVFSSKFEDKESWKSSSGWFLFKVSQANAEAMVGARPSESSVGLGVGGSPNPCLSPPQGPIHCNIPAGGKNSIKHKRVSRP